MGRKRAAADEATIDNAPEDAKRPARRTSSRGKKEGASATAAEAPAPAAAPVPAAPAPKKAAAAAKGKQAAAPAAKKAAAPRPPKKAATRKPAKAVKAAEPAAEPEAPETQAEAAAGEEKPAAARGGKRAAAAAAGGGKTAATASKPKPDYYLMKSEPDTFSIDDLEGRPGQTEPWDGVRNVVARNVMQSMRLGDRCFLYHSSCKVPGIVGLLKVVKEAYPDHTQFDSSSQYHDPKATQDKPKWFMVDVQLERRLGRQITLEELKSHKEGGLSGMALFRQSRLSVQPVSASEWDFILNLEAGPTAVKGEA